MKLNLTSDSLRAWALVLGLALWGGQSHAGGPGSALFLNGTSQYVSIPPANNVLGYPIVVSGAYTVELWVNPHHPTNVLTLVDSDSFFFFGIYQGNKIRCNISDGLGITITSGEASYPYSTNIWYHFACVITPTNYAIYANGQQVGSGSYPSNNPVLYNAKYGLYLGRPYNGDTMNGTIDEVRVWYTPRSPADIAANFHSTLPVGSTSLMGIWHLDEDSGIIAHSGEQGPEGILVGSPVWVASTAPIGLPTVSNTVVDVWDSTSAGLSAVVSPSFQNTGAWFEYGPAAPLANVTPVQYIPSYSVPSGLYADINGLSPATRYFYRVVATNSAGTSLGPLLNFTTPLLALEPNGLPGLYEGTVALGDFDNDGKLDILLTGTTNGLLSGAICQVWRNLGNGTFTNMNAGLPAVIGRSVALGDFDNDGNLDILLTGDLAGTQVWRNLGNGTFTNINAGLPSLAGGSVAWGDFDNDGKLDILLTGNSADLNYAYVAQVWRNLGNGTFTNINAGLPGVWRGSLAVGDFDNDGKLDLLLTGLTNSNGSPISQVWRNLGDGTFTNIDAGLPGVYDSSVAWGDFNNDGNLDILLMGVNYAVPSSIQTISQVWRNLGDGTFTNINASLPAVLGGSVAWGDFDNDGKPDILLTGRLPNSATGMVSVIWRNLGGDAFTELDAGLPGVYLGAGACADFEDSGTLGVLLSGTNSGVGLISQVFRNVYPLANSPPAAPSGLAAQVTGTGSVRLTWNASNDAQTAAGGLSYNVRVGTSPGAYDIVSPQSDPITGRRRLPQLGNAQERLFVTLTNLPLEKTFYWSVQAVDTSFAGSPFAGEATFTTVTRQRPFPVIGGLDASRAGAFSPEFGTNTTGFRANIATNFSEASFSSTNILTGDFLNSIDVLVISAVFGPTTAISPLSASEQTALVDFVSAGGRALLFADNNFQFQTASESIVSPFGLNCTGVLAGSVPAVVTNLSNPVASGAFGAVTNYTIASYPGWFDTLGPYAIPIAILAPNNQVSLAVIPPGTVTGTSGAVVLFSDSTIDDGSFSGSVVTLVDNALSYVLGIQARPILSISATNNSVIVSWAPDIVGYRLQQSTSLASGTWIDQPLTGTNQAVVFVTNSQSFFRLIKP